LIDDFRIYDHALSGGEIFALAVPSPAVIVPDPRYEAWAAGISFPPGGDLATSDPDRDGVVNLLEWLFGSDPLLSTLDGFPVAKIVPAVEVGQAGEDYFLTLSARVRRNRPGTTLVPEAAASPADLGTATAQAHALFAGPPVNAGDFEILTWYYDSPVGTSPDDNGFMRLKVVKN
jgi:hypothetical protein